MENNGLATRSTVRIISPHTSLPLRKFGGNSDRLPFSNIRTSVLQWYETHRLITLLDEASLKLNKHRGGFSRKQQIVRRTFIEYLLGKTHDRWISGTKRPS
jgi:hypothetical protein